MKRLWMLGILLVIGFGVGLRFAPPPATDALTDVARQIGDERLLEKANAQSLTAEETRRLHELLGRYDAINAQRAAKLLARLKSDT